MRFRNQASYIETKTCTIARICLCLSSSVSFSKDQVLLGFLYTRTYRFYYDINTIAVVVDLYVYLSTLHRILDCIVD